MNVYLYVNYALPEISSLEEIDLKIETFMAAIGAEWIGSGAGFGGRDVEFKVSTPLSQEWLNAHAVALRQHTGIPDLMLSQDAWGEENDLDEDGEVRQFEEHQLTAA